VAPGHVGLEEVLELEYPHGLSTSSGGRSARTLCLPLSATSRYEVEEGVP